MKKWEISSINSKKMRLKDPKTNKKLQVFSLKNKNRLKIPNKDYKSKSSMLVICVSNL